MIVCYYLWWSEYLLQGLSIPWYMSTIDLSKYVLCHMVLDCMSCIGIMCRLARFCRTPHADTHYHSVPVLWILWILFAWSCVPHLDLLNATIIKGFYDWEILKQDRNIICNSFLYQGPQYCILWNRLLQEAHFVKCLFLSSFHLLLIAFRSRDKSFCNTGSPAPV